MCFPVLGSVFLLNIILFFLFPSTSSSSSSSSAHPHCLGSLAGVFLFSAMPPSMLTRVKQLERDLLRVCMRDCIRCVWRENLNSFQNLIWDGMSLGWRQSRRPVKGNKKTYLGQNGRPHYVGRTISCTLKGVKDNRGGETQTKTHRHKNVRKFDEKHMDCIQ